MTDITFENFYYDIADVRIAEAKGWFGAKYRDATKSDHVLTIHSSEDLTQEEIDTITANGEAKGYIVTVS